MDQPWPPSAGDRLPLMIDLSSPEVTPDERALLAERRVAGVCLFGRNVRDRSQVAEYVSELRELAGEDLVVAVDQEGGGVLRLFDVPTPPAAMALGAADDPDLTRRVAAATARGLRAVGVNLDFAPVADVNSNPANPVIADRSFGADPELVARHVAAFVTGLQEEGVGATLKHFPGHGDTDVDSHLALPTVARPLDELRRVELPPFAAGIAAGAAAVMSAHIVLPALDRHVPSTLSGAALRGLLREELGFDGVIVTDALDMRAISDRWPAPVAAVMALTAGADLPLTLGPVRQHDATLRAIDAAVAEGRLDRGEVAGSLVRLANLAYRFPGGPADPDAAWREGDEELLAEAARRGLVVTGEPPRLRPGDTALLVARAEVRASAASQVSVRPADPLARALERRGLTVRRVDAADPAADPRTALAGADAVVYASTTRVLPPQEELDLAARLRAAAQEAGVPFVHVALWNPYAAERVPAPAVVAFGFRDRQAAAVAERLVG
ncbi:MAG TPA: beta-N-acetylhexosaminidase [Trueperaceae bacterium]|nr:beta-N-acetylhexosaminidase [Trueperaceae bacterium]